MAQAFVDLLAPWVRMDAFKALVANAENPIQPLDDWVQSLLPSTGFTEDKLRFLLIMFASWPLGIIHRNLPQVPFLKHVYTAGIGIFFAWFSFREQFLHTLITAVVTYVLALVLGRNSKTPVIILVLNCVYLFTCHIYMQFSNWGGYQLDFTTLQMIFTIKLSQFGYNVYDGHQGENCLPCTKQWALSRFPNPLEFLGFLYYFPGVGAGPAFEISDYIAFTERASSHYPKGFPSQLTGFVEFFKKFAILILAYVGLMVAGMYSPSAIHCDPKDTEDLAYSVSSAACEDGGLSNWFASLSIPMRIGYLLVAHALCRHSYYFAWTLSDMGSTLTGLAYQVKAEKVKGDKEVKQIESWDRVTNCDILKIETGQSTRTCINAWNLGTTHWIRYYIYERLILAGLPRSTSSNLSFLTSAFWHGFYPGYYLTFFCGHIATETSKNMRKWLRPKFQNAEKKTPLWYNMAGMVISSLALNSIVWPFMALDLNSSYVAISSCYGIPLIVLAIVWLVSSSGAAAAKKAAKKAAKDKAQ